MTELLERSKRLADQQRQGITEVRAATAQKRKLRRSMRRGELTHVSRAALRAAKELSEVCNLFGYGEIKPLGSRYYESSMLNIFRRLDADNFQTVLIERKEDIWPSFKAFLAKDRGREQVGA